MAKEYAKKFYGSKAWKECRKSFIQTRISIDGATCQRCKEVRGYIIDHIEEVNITNINDPLITLNHDNLQYLCLECHNKKTFGKYSILRENLFYNVTWYLGEE